MKFSIKPKDEAKLDVDVLILFSFKDGISKIRSLGSEVDKIISESASREEFKGEEREFLFVFTKGLIFPYKILVVGVGSEDDFTLYKLRNVVGRGVKKSREARPKRIGISTPKAWLKKYNSQEIGQAVVEAVSLSTYQFIKYKSEKERNKIKSIDECYLQISAGELSSFEKGVNIGRITSRATILARDLVNGPSEETSPQYLAQVAREVEKASKDKVKVTIFEKKEIEKLGMNAYLGVAKGSSKPLKMIRLEYKGRSSKQKIVLIGKGVTFDTGGLSLKPGKSMELMKMDMAGGAAILGIFSALHELLPNVHVVGFIAACENMPSSKALKPGDILRAYSGKTIEVINTDAEGRLTLSDILSYAKDREKPDVMIDIATLTGACMVALGLEIAGLWGNNEELLSKIQKASVLSGEKLWQMPLESEYRRLIKSDVADIRNIEKGRYGGAITAALFLKEFVSKVPWVHIDIAGPAFYQNNTPIIPKGASGFGVRLILHYLLDL